MPMPAVPPQGEAQLNDNARTVISKRYLIKDATGAPVEQPEDMFWRVAGTVAEADRRYGSSDNEVTETAHDFSKLRGKGSMVRSTTGVASGPVSFMKLYDASTDAVKQGGTRRGANMGILRVDHPDILEFISCKEDLTQITNFNISVAITDAFMRAVKAGTNYDLIDPSTGKATAQLDARTV